jgi:cell division protein FtsW (lipid II flippase)
MLVVIPVAVASLAVTLIGIPLALVMLAFYIATLLLAASSSRIARVTGWWNGRNRCRRHSGRA